MRRGATRRWAAIRCGVQRFDPLGCGAGQRCQVVIRRRPVKAILIYTGCVEGLDARATAILRSMGRRVRSVSRRRAGRRALRRPLRRRPVLRRRSRRARPLHLPARMRVGRFEGQLGVACGSDEQYCTGPGPYEEFAATATTATRTAGAAAARACCYLRLNDTGTGVLTCVLPTLARRSRTVLNARPIGTVRRAARAWDGAHSAVALGLGEPVAVPAQLHCRDDDADAGMADGTVDDGEDGGVSGGGGCRGGSECVAFEGSGLDLGTVSGRRSVRVALGAGPRQRAGSFGQLARVAAGARNGALFTRAAHPPCTLNPIYASFLHRASARLFQRFTLTVRRW